MIEENIKNQNELEFAIFCIENIALKLNINGKKAYEILAEKNDILHDYIIPEYDILHTQSKEYIINDILELIKERGIVI